MQYVTSGTCAFYWSVMYITLLEHETLLLRTLIDQTLHHSGKACNDSEYSRDWHHVTHNCVSEKFSDVCVCVCVCMCMCVCMCARFMCSWHENSITPVPSL